MMIFVVGVVGLMLGSFLSVLIQRWPSWRGVAMGRSECPHCKHVLAWYDLIPLLSWVQLRGKCRYCRAPISWFYPILEVSVASALVASTIIHGIGTEWYIADLVMLFGLITLFFFDLRHHMLPDAIMAPLAGLVILRLGMLRPDLLLNNVAMGTLLAALVGLLYLVSNGRWIGFGDVKLAFVIGSLFGYPGAIGVTLIAIWTGALVGVALIALRRASMETALPFGSFWTAAAVMMILWPAPVHFLSGLLIPTFQ